MVGGKKTQAYCFYESSTVPMEVYNTPIRTGRHKHPRSHDFTGLPSIVLIFIYSPVSLLFDEFLLPTEKKLMCTCQCSHTSLLWDKFPNVAISRKYSKLKVIWKKKQLITSKRNKNRFSFISRIYGLGRSTLAKVKCLENGTFPSFYFTWARVSDQNQLNAKSY